MFADPRHFAIFIIFIIIIEILNIYFLNHTMKLDLLFIRPAAARKLVDEGVTSLEGKYSTPLLRPPLDQQNLVQYK